jgi:hypothetical protein
MRWRVFHQPQDFVIFRRAQHLDKAGMDGVEESAALVSKPTRSHFNQNIGHVISLNS